MKKILRSTFGTLMVTVFLTVSSTTYARGGRLGDHGVRRGGHGGHGGFHHRGERAHQFARTMRGHARFVGRAGNWDSGRDWGGSSWYSSYGYSRFGYYGLGYVYPFYGVYGYSGYYYGPYRYGYWPNLSISLGVLGPLR